MALAVAHSFPYGTIEFIAHRRLLTVNDYRSRFIRLTNRQHFHSDFIIHIRISRSLWSLALISIAINFMDFIVHFYFLSLSLSPSLSFILSRCSTKWTKNNTEKFAFPIPFSFFFGSFVGWLRPSSWLCVVSFKLFDCYVNAIANHTLYEPWTILLFRIVWMVHCVCVSVVWLVKIEKTGPLQAAGSTPKKNTSIWISMMTVLSDGYFMFYCFLCCAYMMISLLDRVLFGIFSLFFSLVCLSSRFALSLSLCSAMRFVQIVFGWSGFMCYLTIEARIWVFSHK